MFWEERVILGEDEIVLSISLQIFPSRSAENNILSPSMDNIRESGCETGPPIDSQVFPLSIERYIPKPSKLATKTAFFDTAHAEEKNLAGFWITEAQVSPSSVLE